MTNLFKYATYLFNETVGFNIVITLNDECKNGHADFHITGTMYDLTKQNKKPSRSNEMCSGSIGGEIVKHFPQFAIFEQLHGNDFEGTPMYAVENGFYHMKDKKVAMCYLDITENEFDILAVAHTDNDKKYFHFLIQETLDLPKRWKAKAFEAIEWLENNAQTIYEGTHGVGTFKRLTEEETTIFVDREKNGYYQTENIEKRRKERADAKIAVLYADIEKEYNDVLDKANRKKQFAKAIVNFFGEKVCVVYYNHNNTFKFNWYGSQNHVTDEQIKTFIESDPNLPEGCKMG